MLREWPTLEGSYNPKPNNLNAKSSYNVELMFAASFDSKMGCLYYVFDVKKQGKPVWVVRTRNWKLRGGENRLSRLLEGVSGEITWEFFQSAFRKKYLGTRYADEKKREFMALVQGGMSVTDYEIQFVRLSQYAPELVPTERDRSQISAILVLSIGTLSGVSIPKSNTGIWVSVPAREGIDTPCITPGLSCGMTRPRGGGRRGGRAPVHLDEIGMEPVIEETLPPPPPAAFRKKYLGTRYADEKKREFMALVQGGMSVTDYEIQFVRLSQYAHELVPTERDRSLEAQRLMDDSCQAYLAYVMNPNMGEARPRDIRTVCDFPGVFPEELPGLPPDREVEFVIETHADYNIADLLTKPLTQQKHDRHTESLGIRYVSDWS
ncbi:hypothetical protein GQ457_15G017170 [Hibiscus cannabinus]